MHLKESKKKRKERRRKIQSKIGRPLTEQKEKKDE